MPKIQSRVEAPYHVLWAPCSPYTLRNGAEHPVSLLHAAQSMGHQFRAFRGSRDTSIGSKRTLALALRSDWPEGW